MPGPKPRMKKEEGHRKQIPETVATQPMPGPKPRLKKEEGHQKIAKTVVTPPRPGPKPRMKKRRRGTTKKLENVFCWG